MSDDVIYGDKEYQPYAPLYPTPAEIPLETACFSISLPNSPAWWGLLFGAMMVLNDPENFQVFEGGLSRETTAEIFENALFDAWEELSCGVGVPSPYWDEAQDLDDELPTDIQPWYGIVTDYTAPPYELDFVTAAGVWVITGFVAYAAGIGAAVAFQTIAPRFILAWKRRDIGELFRVVIDAADYGTVDTSTVAEDEIIELAVLPDPDLETHDILIVKVG